MKVICICLGKDKKCNYCKGTGVVEVKVIGEPYPTE